MRIYLGHSAGFDFQKELYQPLKASEFYKQHTIILPHDGNESEHRDKSFYADLDLFIAEVSYPSTGLGIELAWAHDAKVKIICLHRSDRQPSWALQAICQNIISYSSPAEMIEILQQQVA